MLKLKLQCFGHLMWRADSLKKTIMLGKTEGRRRTGDRGWDGWVPSVTQWTWVWVSSGSWWWTGRPGVLQATGSQRGGHDWATELNWTDTYTYICFLKRIRVKREICDRESKGPRSPHLKQGNPNYCDHTCRQSNELVHIPTVNVHLYKLQTCAPLENHVIKCTLCRVET